MLSPLAAAGELFLCGGVDTDKRKRKNPAIAAVDSTGGTLELLGEQYDSAPYGYVLKKEDTAFGEAIVEALKQLKADGTYDQILTKWKTEGGAISDFAVNPTVS